MCNKLCPMCKLTFEPRSKTDPYCKKCKKQYYREQRLLLRKMKLSKFYDKEFDMPVKSTRLKIKKAFVDNLIKNKD